MPRMLAAAGPASGAVVMATGIVSVDLALDGDETLSRLLLGLAVACWAALGIVLLLRAWLEAARVRLEATSPSALTGVAGTAVLGTRFTMLGWRWAAIALGAISLGLWLALLGPVLRNATGPAAGASFMPTVSTEALAVLAAVLGIREHAGWLQDGALVLFAGGLLLYAWVLARFDVRELLNGRGDHWVSGGALAISALAAGTITEQPDPVAIAVWVAAMLWLPALIAAELARPRLRYDVARWATVFPVGMYAACSSAVGTRLDAPALTRFAAVWTWVAFAVWLVVLAAMASALFRSPQRA